MHVYVANSASGTVSQYTIGANGALTSIATPVATGPIPFSVAIDPSGRHAYVANNGGNNVSQYTIGADGSLSPMSTAAVAAGTHPPPTPLPTPGQHVYTVYKYGDNSPDNKENQHTLPPHL